MNFMISKDRLPETIDTARLLLRPPHVSDLDDLVREINNPKVLEPTASLPFPICPTMAAPFSPSGSGLASIPM
ncbi:GNAT family N-acetyltransferase [Devosia aurantiaca]|uniref:GNAT family N-acetyltransferase n=1 Tax=Devosia aurantiaca TaxID=2714858 RepID=A0A6M1SI77_9HYPH|nr:GNAT family protein [Devosia aurantiaca]NGP16554.1 GNAT family N-acetyltransferase [Devosia aurantiaca]